TRIADLERDPLVRELSPVLAEAAHAVASPQLRTMGTVGGNICQEPRCWYYRAAGDAFHCTRKGGRYCNALTGDNRYHSLFGSLPIQTRPCTAACPGEIEIPEYLELLRAGDVDGAARRLLARNPLPAITGRVCPHTCQDDCNRGLYDGAVSIRTVERYLGDHVLEHPELMGTPAPASGRRVAVVGSGPAGLAAAFYLRLRGHAVTVFEREPQPGGMLRYGIPSFRLPKDVLDRLLGACEGLGVEFRCGVALGGPAGGDAAGAADPAGADSARGSGDGDRVELDELRAAHDGVFLATGAWGLPRIGLAGEEELAGGLAFLTDVAKGARRVPGPRLLVVGGGSVAFDVAVTARRLGARQVTVACLESCDEMPALLEEVEEAQAEGIELLPSCGPARLLREDRRLTGIELVRCTSVFDEQCCFAPSFDESERVVVEADEVILAVGQRVEADTLARTGLELDGVRLAADGETGRTSAAGVYAGGDVVSGPATVIAAIAAGRRAAAALDEELGGLASARD
ncbi:MAG: FAD-dependent oxidoreductase, partial [Actinobacteria bacterium]|nr:FAD-dependent oxidoreductase [Actinomycetota bacterium]